jgi:hypothetical protein
VHAFRRIHVTARICFGDREIRIVKSGVAETVTELELWRYIVGDEMLVVDVDTFGEVIYNELVVSNVACGRSTSLG